MSGRRHIIPFKEKSKGFEIIEMVAKQKQDNMLETHEFNVQNTYCTVNGMYVYIKKGSFKMVKYKQL